MQFLSISLDPERDTPETLRQYARTQGVGEAADWRFATGAVDVIDRLTTHFSIQRQPQTDGQIDHTLTIFVFDASGRLVQRYGGTEVDAARLTREIGAVDRLFGAPRAQ